MNMTPHFFIPLLFKINGIYDIVSSLSLLNVVYLPLINKIHASMIKTHSLRQMTPLTERYMAYWVMTNGLIRLRYNMNANNI